MKVRREGYVRLVINWFVLVYETSVHSVAEVSARISVDAGGIRDMPGIFQNVSRPSRRERLGAERDRGRDQHGGAIGHGRMSGIDGEDSNKMVLTT
ncbi:hypothetical protein TNCV_2601451 [Trichonephila clavipes]|nr:hypothetical protein TNCV_2601451 [Trichonephila clavipes]